MKNVPNVLTIFRLFLVPLFLMIYFSEMKNHMEVSLAIYLVASATDLLDGYIARKYNSITIIGTVLDPLADKLMLVSVLWALSETSLIPGFIFVAVFVKEFIMIVAGCVMYCSKERIVVPANKYGKVATVMFAAAIVLSFLFPGTSLSKGVAFVSIGVMVLAFFSYARTALCVHRKRSEASR